MGDKKSFFTSIPALLTALATLITAIVGLIYAVENHHPDPNPVIETGGMTVTVKTDTVTPVPPPPPPERWAVIGARAHGKVVAMFLDTGGAHPVIGKTYPVTEDVAVYDQEPKLQDKGKLIETAHRGDKLKILVIHAPPPDKNGPIRAKVQIVPDSTSPH